jgi:hypothetical protein
MAKTIGFQRVAAVSPRGDKRWREEYSFYLLEVERGGATFGATNNGQAEQAPGFAGCSPDLFTSKV